jgi:hypothetical protein
MGVGGVPLKIQLSCFKDNCIGISKILGRKHMYFCFENYFSRKVNYFFPFFSSEQVRVDDSLLGCNARVPSCLDSSRAPTLSSPPSQSPTTQPPHALQSTASAPPHRKALAPRARPASDRGRGQQVPPRPARAAVATAALHSSPRRQLPAAILPSRAVRGLAVDPPHPVPHLAPLAAPRRGLHLATGPPLLAQVCVLSLR